MLIEEYRMPIAAYLMLAFRVWTELTARFGGPLPNHTEAGSGHPYQAASIYFTETPRASRRLGMSAFGTHKEDTKSGLAKPLKGVKQVDRVPESSTI